MKKWIPVYSLGLSSGGLSLCANECSRGLKRQAWRERQEEDEEEEKGWRHAPDQQVLVL